MYKLTLNQYIAANITSQFSQDVDEFILSELSESATSLNTILLEGRNESIAILIRLMVKGGKGSKRRSLAFHEKRIAAGWPCSVSLARTRANYCRPATNKIVRGTIRLKRYYARDMKVRYRLRDFVEIAPRH